MLTVTEAAVRLGLSPQRLRAMIAAGQLKATKKGKTWIIAEPALRALAGRERKPGRPKR